MSMTRFVLWRTAFALVSVLILFTASFAFVTLTQDPNVGRVAYGASVKYGPGSEEVEEAMRTYRESHNLDDPIHERYLTWIEGFLTLNWGVSFNSGVPVTSLLAQRLPYTLLYVVPAVVVSGVVGTLVGLRSATGATRFDRVATATSYLAFGLPNFFLATILSIVALSHLQLWWTLQIRPGTPPFAAEPLAKLAFPAGVLATTLIAGQLRYTRAETRHYALSEFAKLARAKGAGKWRVARHVLRAAMLPLTTLALTDLFGLVVVQVFVLEFVFGVPGIGDLALKAIIYRDLPVILGVSMAIAIAGISLKLFRDLLSVTFDPRVAAGE